MERNLIAKNSASRKPCIYILALGGTISSVVKNSTEEFYSHPTSNIKEILLSFPSIGEDFTIIAEQFLQKISHEITHSDLINIANKIKKLSDDDNINGIIVTQGTNCIEETAYFINLVVNTKKTIVFTGSHRPQNSIGFDGGRNLYNAILLASSKKTSGMGVLLTFNDCIINARYASKLNPSLQSGFSSGGLGLVGFVQGKEIFIQQLPNYKHTFLSEFNISDITVKPKIYVIYGHLDMDNFFVDAAIESNAQGIISAGMGKGYQPKVVTQALVKASKRGLIVVRCSRTGYGVVNNEANIDGVDGFIAGGSLSPQKARILLSIALNKTQDKTTLQRIFNEY
jgi:L-asparaginase